MAHSRSLLICVILLLCLIAVLFFVMKPEEEEVYLVYTAVFEVDASLADSIQVGDLLTDARGKGQAGEVLKITREDAYREDAFGIYFHPERVTLAVTLGGGGVRRRGEAKLVTLVPRVGEAIYLLGSTRLEGLCVKVGVV